ncbi:hypothetical protein J437_LFUL009046 [Ladona fulva]|uniref:Cytochrome P450 n=1 Tax=Ladona fulva TaxID=123851 RepID=A0A8K0K5V2_LADFU|nr:hypothetical protein J437_LFUL009046 [Ladona fulva]
MARTLPRFALRTDSRQPEEKAEACPGWLPILGSTLEFTKLFNQFKIPFLMWDEYARRFGDVVGIRLGRDIFILVSGKEAIQEGLTKEEFDARENSFLIQHRSMGVRRGVIFTDGEEWKEQRRFTLRNLRDLGFGKRSMESMIREEAVELVSRLTEMGKKTGSKGVNMENMYTIPVLNSLWTMMSGQRCPQDDESLRKFTGLVIENSRSVSSSARVINSFPWLRFFSPWFARHHSIRNELWKYFEDTVDEHKKTKTDGDPRDLIDTFLDEMKKKKGEKSTFTEKQLIALCDDLFAGGTETTSNTLSFGTMYLLHHPDVQEKLHEELDRVVGKDRVPTIEDRPNLPYLNATLMEIRRCCNVGSLTLPHRCTKDTMFRGYFIPKGASILFRLRSVHMDPGYWGDPEVFRPERFLTPGENGGPMKVKEEPPWLIPFGLGGYLLITEFYLLTNIYING